MVNRNFGSKISPPEILYSDEPRPEYAPKKKSVNNPRAASPPTVATIQRGTLPISLILIKFFKKQDLYIE